MVWSRETEAERPPLSAILPRLYLGAESDVTQDRLASLGISYVLSVSRCSPPPSFLPSSRYLRIPIDDSLRDDLLPWIPQALRFIDAAMSSGAAVLVHCAAGISRSPALAVAYIMYSLGLDLDHAYRFVKERRPSISPNFNFLGQLQHFQGTLSQRAAAGELPPIQRLDARLPSIADAPNHAAAAQDTRQNPGQKAGHEAAGAAALREGVHHTDQPQQRHSDGGADQPPSLADKLWTVGHQQRRREDAAPPPLLKPTQLQLPASSASLLEKRKSLSLSLTPLGVGPAGIGQSAAAGISTAVHRREPERNADAKTPPTNTAYCREAEQSPAHAQGKEAGLLSPLTFTLNKLLGWGERVLLGGLFVHPVRMGQSALPYRC